MLKLTIFKKQHACLQLYNKVGNLYRLNNLIYKLYKIVIHNKLAYHSHPLVTLGLHNRYMKQNVF